MKNMLFTKSGSFAWPLGKNPNSQKNHRGQMFDDTWNANPLKKHTGLDWIANPGEEVSAIESGIVVKIGFCGKSPSPNNHDWAKYVILKHGWNLYSCYLHINEKVALGQKIKFAETIGTIADMWGPHLHFGIWYGPYDEKIAPRGALPTKEHVGKIFPKEDPVFPGHFIDPRLVRYLYWIV